MDAIVRQKLEEAIAKEKADAVDLRSMYSAYFDLECMYLQTLTETELLEIADMMQISTED